MEWRLSQARMKPEQCRQKFKKQAGELVSRRDSESITQTVNDNNKMKKTLRVYLYVNPSPDDIICTPVSPSSGT